MTPDEAMDLESGVLLRARGHYYSMSSYDEEREQILGHPAGGGFRVRIPIADITEWGEAASEIFGSTAMRLVPIEICETGGMTAWVHPDEHFYGWAMPVMDRQQLETAIGILNATADECPGCARWELRGDTLFVDNGEYGDNYDVDPRTYNTVSGEITGWDVSLGFCWEIGEGSEGRAARAESAEAEATAAAETAAYEASLNTPDKLIDQFLTGTLTEEEMKTRMRGFAKHNPGTVLQGFYAPLGL